MKTNPAISTLLAALMSGAMMSQSAAQITVGGDGANTTDLTSYSGAQSLTKIGSNTVTLGVRSFYSGPTFVEAGNLVVVASGANFTPNNPNTSYVVSDGATLTMGSGSTWAALWNRPVTLNGGTLVSANQNNADSLGSLTMNGGRVTGNSYRVYDGNTWNLSGTNSIETALGFLNFGTPTGLTLNVTDGTTTLSGQMFGFLGAAQFVQKTGSGTAVLTANNGHGETRIQGGTLRLGNGGTTGSLGSGAVINNAALAFDRSNEYRVDNLISGTGTVTQQGTGTTRFNANNTYSGGLAVTGGAAHGLREGAFGTGGVTLERGTLLITRESNLSVSNPITVSAAGSGAAEIAGSSTGSIMTFSGDITLGRDVNLGAFNTVSRTDFSGNMTGAGGVTVTGGRVLFTTTGKTYTGGTTVNAGTILQLSGAEMLPDAQDVTVNGTLHLASSGGTETIGGLSGTGRVEALLGGNYELVVGNAGTANFAGTIANNAGVVALTKAGSGTQVLSGGNIYTGATTINAGTLQVGDGGTTGTLGSGAVTNNATLAIERSNAYTLANIVSGTGGLVQRGAGTTTITSNNTYTGGTVVNSGTLLLGSAERLADSGAVTVTGGSFNLGGFSESIGAVTLGGGSITNGTLTGSSYDMQSGTVSAVLAGNAAVSKNGTGTVTLSGANTYSGATTINGGTLATSGDNRIATSNSVTVNAAGTFALGGNQTLASVTGSGAIQLGDHILTTGASNSTYSGTMAGNGGLTKSGAGTFTLSGTSTFTGDTNLTGGTLVLANANALASDAVVIMNTGATLTVNQRTFIGALEQGGGTVNGPGQLVSTLTLTSNGSLNAVLADGPDFAAGILKRTSGTTTIGAANTFTGAVKIQGGTLELGAGGSFAAGSSLVLSAGATMDLNNKSQTFSAVSGQGGTLAMGSGSLTVNQSTDTAYNGVVTGTGSLTKQGAGTLTLGGNNTYSGGTTVSGGKLAGTTASLKGAVTNNAQVEFAQDADGTYSGNMAGSGALIKSGTGTVTLSGSNTHSGGTTISDGKLVAGTANLQGNMANNAAFEISQNSNGTYAGDISGSGSLSKSGTGTVTLSGSNTYSGGTTVSAGKLVGNSASLQGDVTNNAAVEFNQAGSGTYLGAMDGTGSLAKSGTGTLVMSGTSTYTGATTVQAGQLTVDGSITSTATVQSGARIGGSGRVGGLILDSGSTLAPGNSPGSLSVTGDATWNSGANYNWQVLATNTNPAVQTGAGTGWDFLDVTGTLTLSGLDSSNRFNLNLWSLSSTSPDTNGTIPGWDASVGSTWLIASAAGGINLDGTSLAANTNYSSLFNINTAATNGTGGWIGALPSNFQVLTLGDANALYLQAVAGSAAVPEPGQIAASALLLIGIGGYVWLKRRKAAKALKPA